MKRLGRVWPDVISFENLLKAYLKARKGKQSKPAVAEFTLNLESELLGLQQDLIDFSYQPDLIVCSLFTSVKNVRSLPHRSGIG